MVVQARLGERLEDLVAAQVTSKGVLHSDSGRHVVLDRDEMGDHTVAAKQGEQLDQVVNMLRRRESQLKRAEAEVRKLRRQLGLDPDPTPSGDASDAPTSQKPTKKARSARKKKSKGARGDACAAPL